MNDKSDLLSIQGDAFIEQLREKVDNAIESREAKEVAIVQLEIQFAMLQYLQRLDWKLWELYNKFGI
jgi:hypothetical protein